MAQALGYVTQTEEGNFVGKLGMGLNTRIDITANGSKETEKQPDFRIYASNGGEIGGGWTRRSKSSGKDYVSLTLAHPMIGPRKIYANLGQAAGGAKEEFAILWNPAD